jgi:hypothetical protein
VAWQGHNWYISSEVILTAPSSWTFPGEGTAGHAHVHIANSADFSQYVVMVNVSLGHPHAIGRACASPC